MPVNSIAFDLLNVMGLGYGSPYLFFGINCIECVIK